MKRRLKIDMADLAIAFEASFDDCEWHLDLETGNVIMVTEEFRSGYSQVTEIVESRGLEFEEALAVSSLADWMKEMVALIHAIEHDPDRFLWVPQDDSRDAYRDMEAFTETVSNRAVRSRLEAALAGNRPFRRFKDAIAEYPKEEERWFAFRDERLNERVLAWLDEEGIEVIE